MYSTPSRPIQIYSSIMKIIVGLNGPFQTIRRLYYSIHRRGTTASDSALQTPTVTTPFDTPSPTDAKTPTPFFDADDSMMDDAPMMDNAPTMDLQHPNTVEFGDNSDLATFRRPLPVSPRHGAQRLSSSDTASGELIAIPLHYRSHPFTKEEISYPGGPQFSGFR